ncbi:hypothetical protein D1BOALGB6SA_564 [Olavius sp. associated proteobacterium Delta 1]|nr:hypothetical protein D1BOALGB6SA_564 [Olavius sp. associated proteobacterium Delta 1]
MFFEILKYLLDLCAGVLIILCCAYFFLYICLFLISISFNKNKSRN